MIVEFSVKNFRSINSIETLSFSTSALKSSKDNEFIDTNNIVSVNKESLFKTIGIYGPNASGKSNIIKAFDAFVKVLVSQPTSVSNLYDLTQPFLYQDNPESTESYFQIVVLIDGVKYRYGLTVCKNLNDTEISPERSGEIITNEWLYSDKGGKNTLLFLRNGQKLEKNNLQNKSKIPTNIPFKHTLFINHAAAFDTTNDCYFITSYLRGFIVSNFDLNHEKFRWMSVNFFNNEENKKKFLYLLDAFNLKYDDVLLEDNPNDYGIKKVFPQDKIIFKKSFYLDNKEVYRTLNLKNTESAGTQKMFDLTGLLLRAFALNRSALIILDEIDSNFHPSLLIKLIELFNNSQINSSNSQLLFTSHDTNLMSPSIMRRDQFYFTEKKEDFSTRLYSLAELRGIRNDADFAKQYLAGYYGALPYLKNICESEMNGENE